MRRTSVQLQSAVHSKLKRMGFAGQSFNDLIDDLIDFANGNLDEWNSFLDERYDEDEDENEE